MRIVILVEGRTETAFIPLLRNFVTSRLPAGFQAPKFSVNKYDGRIPKGERLRKVVENEITSGADAVLALTDVYTGTNDFSNALDAKTKMTTWTNNNPKFFPHVALHDFEAWLLPYWDEIKKLSGTSRSAPTGSPETMNHNKPPAHFLSEIFLHGTNGRAYSKPRDAARILKHQDIAVAANRCPELKAFLNRILGLVNATPIP